MKYKFTILLSLLVSACSPAPSLLCNFNSADITTTDDEHVILAGFAARNKLSDGIHSPLSTYCLTVTDGKGKVCIISNDLMEISPDLADAIRDSISLRSGLCKERILLHCIHTHSAPRLGGNSVLPGGSNYSYRQRAVKTIIDNAVKTITEDSSYVPFRLELAKGRTFIGYNRCETEGPVSRDLYAARLVTDRDKPVCAFINLACHPVSMGPGSYQVSADYSGVARSIIKEKWGCEVFQLSGAQGNIDPIGGCQKARHAEAIGTQLAESLAELEFKPVRGRGLLGFTSSSAELPFLIDEITPEAVKAHADSIAAAYTTSFPSFAEDVRGWEKQILERFETGGISNTLTFNMAAVNIDSVIFFFTQGEPFCEYQTAAREAFPGRTVFFAGYTGGQNSYLPSAHAYEVRKGYEYEIEQMHVYIKAPYPLSPDMPKAYQEAVESTISQAL